MPIPFNPPEPVYPTFGQSLGQGLNQGVVGGVNAYNDRLKMDEQAKLLQLQLFQYQQKQAEIANTNLEQNVEFSAKYGIPNPRQDISKALAFRSGTGPDPGDPSLIANTDRMLAQGQQRQVKAATQRSQRPQLSDVNGRRVAITFNEKGEVANRQDLGASASFAKSAADANAEFGAVSANLDILEELVGGFITATGPGGNLAQYAKSTLSQFSSAFPDAKIYLDERDAFLASLSRASGERGVLTDQDVARVKNALPGPSDTVEVAARKFEIARKLYENIFNAKMTAYRGEPDSANNGSKETPKTSGENAIALTGDKAKRYLELKKKLGGKP